MQLIVLVDDNPANVRFMRDLAHELGFGQLVSLIPELANPKDLFSLIRSASISTAEATVSASASAAPRDARASATAGAQRTKLTLAA